MWYRLSLTWKVLLIILCGPVVLAVIMAYLHISDIQDKMETCEKSLIMFMPREIFL